MRNFQSRGFGLSAVATSFLALGLVACSPCTTRTLRVVPSPRPDFAAIVFERSCPTGPSTVELSAQPPSTLPKGVGNLASFGIVGPAGANGALDISWSGDASLSVRYFGGELVLLSRQAHGPTRAEFVVCSSVVDAQQGPVDICTNPNAAD